MRWHDIADPASSELDNLASAYSLHQLHIDDCRTGGQRAKVVPAADYLFIVLKLLTLEGDDDLMVGDIGLFVGSEFLITVHEIKTSVLDASLAATEETGPDEVLYQIMDRVVDSYLPLIEQLQDVIDTLQDQVLGRPDPSALEHIGQVRSTLMKLTRVTSNTRHAVFQLRHVPSPLIGQELLPFLRDVHDDLAIQLDMIEGERDRLTGVLDVYLSGVAIRATEATRTLTLLGTAAVPTLVITSLFGMGIDYPAWTRTKGFFGMLVALALAVTVFLLWFLRRQDYLPGGRTSRDSASETRPQL